jgi:hypothetical protein
VASLIGFVYHLVAEVVRPRSRGGWLSGVGGCGQAVQCIVLIGRNMAKRVCVGDFVSVRVVRRTGRSSQRGRCLDQVAERVVSVGSGCSGQVGVGVRQWLDHRDLVAKRIVSVGRSATERVCVTGHVAIRVVGKLRGFGRVGTDVIADRSGLDGAIVVEDKGRESANSVRYALWAEVYVVIERAHVTQLVRGLGRFAVLVVGRGARDAGTYRPGLRKSHRRTIAIAPASLDNGNRYVTIANDRCQGI